MSSLNDSSSGSKNDSTGKSGDSKNDSATKSGGHTTMPQVSFSTFILSLYSSALVQLGEVPDLDTGSVSQNLEIARHSIDIISMLFEKTRNNLDADEMRLIEDLLYELRMKYIVKSKS